MRRERARGLLVDLDGTLRRWDQHQGTVDPDVLALIHQVRSAGLPVGLATNATDRLTGNLGDLGLTDGVLDAVIHSSQLGVHKPAKEYFLAACDAIGVPPQLVLLVDDSDRAVRGARAAGLAAYRWSGPAGLPYIRAALGL